MPVSRWDGSLKSALGTELNDPSRRSIALTLLSAFGGAAVLDACAGQGTDVSDESLASLSDALTGTNVRWVDAIGTSPVTGTNLNLRGHVGSNSAPLAVALGFASRGDGGGGIFAWLTTAAVDDGGTIIVANQSAGSATPGAHWKRIYSGPLNVKWFGATGNGTTADDGALQAAINAAPRDGATVYLPPGTYRIVQPLQVIDGTNGQRGLTMTGANSGASGLVNTVILWDGASAEPPTDITVFKLHSRDCIVSNLAFFVKSGKTVLSVIDIDTSTSAGASICTNNQFANVQILTDRVNQGNFWYAVRIASATTSASNCENMKFTACLFQYPRKACVQIVHQNSKQHTFRNCDFLGYITSAPIPPSVPPVYDTIYGIDCQGGTFQTYSCGFGSLAKAINLYGPTDNVLIQDCDSEACAQFLVADGANNSGAYPVTIAGGRFVADYDPTGASSYISFPYGGPLYVWGCSFEASSGGYFAPFKIFAGCPDPGCVLVAIGNSFPTTDPFTSGPSYMQLVSWGNRGLASGNVRLLLPIETTTHLGAVGGGVSLGAVRGISAGLRAGPNLRGIGITVPASSTQLSINFGAAEQDNAYSVQVTTSWLTQTAVTQKTASGFVVQFGTAPPAAQSLDWLVIR